MTQLTIFLDDGGVMNDNELRGEQWRSQISSYFPPLLGGEPQAWKEANRLVADHMFNADNWLARLQAATNYIDFDRTYQLDWLRNMCELVGVPAPPTEECIELAHRATAIFTRHVRAAFPGAVESICTLHSQGYRLYTASGEPSVDLAGYLEGMEVRGCFDALYGPDLIDTFKVGPRYYEGIFIHAGISPSHALVVDDSPFAIEWATSVGAKTVLVGDPLLIETKALFQIKSLAELPTIIDQLNST